ncbi:MAG: hypothetical protein ACO31I_15815, partial [Prochlorotrichaceae cyanobacterium]
APRRTLPLNFFAFSGKPKFVTGVLSLVLRMMTWLMVTSVGTTIPILAWVLWQNVTFFAFFEIPSEVVVFVDP